MFRIIKLCIDNGYNYLFITDFILIVIKNHKMLIIEIPLIILIIFIFIFMVNLYLLFLIRIYSFKTNRFF